MTALLVTALVIVVNQGSGVTAHNGIKVDQVAAEARSRAVTIIDGPKYVKQANSSFPHWNTGAPLTNTSAKLANTGVLLAHTGAPPAKTGGPLSNAGAPPSNIHKPEQRPPSKPPITPDKLGNQNAYINIPRPYYGQIQKRPPSRHYTHPMQLYHSSNSVAKFPRVIPLPPHAKNHYYAKSRPLVFAASSGKPTYVKSPKFSLPVQTINGIRTDFVRPSKFLNTTSTSTTTTTETTTTTKVLRTKRIWPTRILDKHNTTLHNTTMTNDNTTNINSSPDKTDYDTSGGFQRIRNVFWNVTGSTTTVQPSTTRGYRPVTRIPKVKSTTTSTANFTAVGPNDWVPMTPSHYPKLNNRSPPPINKRSDIFGNSDASRRKRMLYLQSFGLVPVSHDTAPNMSGKKMVVFKRKLNPYYSGYSRKYARPPSRYVYGDFWTEGSHHGPNRPRLVPKIKHHHHHHHHRYIKTVEKPVKVPYKVEVPKPYPVTVEKNVPYPVEKIKVVDRPVPYPVTVEKKIPYPIEIKVPHPVPVKVIEKEYIPKPYPVFHHVPVVKHVQVKVPHPVPIAVEKKVPYPVEVKVPFPVDRPVPFPVPYEKRVPYPVPVKVLVPQPYPVEKKVPYPVEVKVKEPVEVIKHVPVKVPYPQPYAVKVPHPVPVHVEKRVPYPVEVEKKVPVPVKVLVPQRIEVEKKVPVYVPKPYPVEKRIPVPVKVPYPVKVPVQVPVEVPIYIHHPYHRQNSDDHYVTSSISVTEDATNAPQHTATIHGNTGFIGFQSRSDKPDVTQTIAPQS